MLTGSIAVQRWKHHQHDQVGEPANTVGRWELLMEYASVVSVSHKTWSSHIDLLKEIWNYQFSDFSYSCTTL